MKRCIKVTSISTCGLQTQSNKDRLRSNEVAYNRDFILTKRILMKKQTNADFPVNRTLRYFPKAT